MSEAPQMCIHCESPPWFLFLFCRLICHGKSPGSATVPLRIFARLPSFRLNLRPHVLGILDSTVWGALAYERTSPRPPTSRSGVKAPALLTCALRSVLYSLVSSAVSAYVIIDKIHTKIKWDSITKCLALFRLQHGFCLRRRAAGKETWMKWQWSSRTRLCNAIIALMSPYWIEAVFGVEMMDQNVLVAGVTADADDGPNA